MFGGQAFPPEDETNKDEVTAIHELDVFVDVGRESLTYRLELVPFDGFAVHGKV
jgi:hypothetical protein